MKSNLTAVGLGPGDPELITLKGLRAIEAADYVFVPRSKLPSAGNEQTQVNDGQDSISLTIAQPWLSSQQTVVELPLPMTRDANLLLPAWQAAAEVIATTLNSAQTHPTDPPMTKQGVYLLLGDPLLYGTFIYIWQQLQLQAPDIRVEIIPGVTSFSAAAANTGTILSTTQDRLAILPASYEDFAPETRAQSKLRQVLNDFETIILLKAGTVLPQLVPVLEALNLLEQSIYVEKLGLPGERLLKGTAIRPLSSQKQPYLSLIIVRKI